MEGIIMKKIKCGIVGVGNCASSLAQGLYYYRTRTKAELIGLMHEILGGYKPQDIEIVAAFDIDKRKIGKDISQAIFEQPNCTKRFSDVPILNVEVMKCPVLDGVADHMHDYFKTDENQKELSDDKILNVLKESKTDIIINYLPVGSQKATEFWAQIAIDAGCAFINCIPVFVASDSIWAEKFRQANLPIIGDDVKSQLGATILNRYLVQLIQDRGGKIDSSWQTNFGGNTDFLNMTSQDRLESKKISKTESVSSLIPYDSNNTKPYIYAGPNGFIECLYDTKIAYIRIDFKIFGDIPCSIDCKLYVEDSPNSAGIMMDAIRIAKIALDRRFGGPILPACAWMMKHPPIQMRDEDAKNELEKFLK